MKKYNLKRFGVIFFAFFLLFIAGQITVNAIAVPDQEEEGSITVNMNDFKTGRAVSGGTLTLLPVGDLHEEDGDYSFVLTEEFADSEESLESPDAELAKRLAVYAGEREISGTTVTVGDNGKVEFTGIMPGLYLIMQEKAAKGYYTVNPFLVSVPLLEDGVYCYNVDATPKMELLKKKPSSTTEKEPEPTRTTNVTKTPDLSGKNPKTGDHSNLVFWAILMILSAAFFTGTLMSQKRRRFDRRG